MYNEEKRVALDLYHSAFTKYSSIDFLLVNDASTDTTEVIITQLSDTFLNVSSTSNTTNLGKAESIRTAVLNNDLSAYKYVGYMDADLAVPFSEMKRLLDLAVENTSKKLVFGSRIKLISNNIKRSKLRHYFGRIFATIVSQIILKTPIYDTQCGAKVIDTNLAKSLFSKPFKTKWLFDVELLLRYKKLEPDFSNYILEEPLKVWIEKGGTKIKLREFLMFPFQLLKVYFSYK